MNVASPGYALAQLEKALVTAGGHADPATRERAARKVERWKQVLDGMFTGTLAVGSRTPVVGVPAWATLEVAHGGFATGNLLAGGPLQAHEAEMLRRIEAPAGKERAALNLHFLGDEGRAELSRMLASGCYRVQVPEEGALLAVTWLLDRGHAGRAQDVLDAVVPFMGRLRFYPVPDERPLVPSAVVKLQAASQVAEALGATRPRAQIARMNEALRVWAPLYDRAVALFLETVEGETPHLRTDETGALVRRPDGQPITGGGWPCKRYPDGWADRARALLHEYEARRREHALCAKPEHFKENFTILRKHLAACVRDPQALTGRDVGMIRKALASFVTKHGPPGSAKHEGLRAAQARVASRPTHDEIARVMRERLAAYPRDAGLPSVDPVVAPVSEAEASRLGVAAGSPVPASLARKVERCLEAPIEDLVQRRVIPSSEVLAIVLPQITSQVGAAGITDPELGRLYGAIYAAFRRRRSLLLLDLESQVKLEELPWIGAIEAFRTGKLAESERARQTLERVATLAITSFPHTILPNKLLQEMRALVKGAALRLPLVDELAADIFQNEFAGKFVEAAKIAARLLAGSLYARYYGIDADEVLRLGDAPDKQPEYGTPTSPGFAALCNERAGIQGAAGGSWVARNGRIIEEAQILTTHNLAPLFDVLGLARTARGRALELSQACFRFICQKEQIATAKYHAKLKRVKNSAYAWRQMVFFLSFVDGAALQGFLAWAEQHLQAQSPRFRARFSPALRGLAVAAGGGDLGAAERAGEARRFVGWAPGGHWLLAAD